MALTRKFLSAMGIESEKIDQIIEAHTESVDALKAERDKAKEESAKFADVQKELDTLKAEQAKDQPYKEKYETEKKAFEDYKKDQDAKETKAKKTDAYKKLLKDAGIGDKHLEQLLKASGADVDSLEFDDKGDVKDAKKKVESLKKEWSDFVTTEGTKGADTHEPPAGNPSTQPHGTGRAKEISDKYMQTHYGVNPQNQNNNGGKVE